jgi:hypothetical protein
MFSRFGIIATAILFASSSIASSVTATLSCKITWAGAEQPIELKNREACLDGCKVQSVGPDGLSFAGETSSASRLKLTINSLMKNETLIFVKEFEYDKILGTCGDAEITKYGAAGTCTVCVKEQ